MLARRQRLLPTECFGAFSGWCQALPSALAFPIPKTVDVHDFVDSSARVDNTFIQSLLLLG